MSKCTKLTPLVSLLYGIPKYLLAFIAEMATTAQRRFIGHTTLYNANLNVAYMSRDCQHNNVHDSTCVKPVGNDQQMNNHKDDSCDVQVNIRLKKE